ncbi:MAG: carotenoid biosynthesis protein [Longimicrobiales bacterium]|nr:carotenoid biosynthesis protein [Longimicrobiales bacterium]
MTRRALPWAALERWSLIVLGVFTVASVAGYGYYALHPENLPPSGLALRFYTISFAFFAQIHILVAFAALATVLVSRTGAAWIPAMLGIYLLSFTSEHIGTGYGIPFGGYEYTGLLGTRLGSRVPALIPLSWFLMAMPSWIVARHVFPRRLALAVPVGALGLVLWDLALDPAMSFLTPYWRWEDSGPYYGMPWLNLMGWFATGLALMGVLAAWERRGGFHRIPVAWMLSYYGVVLALPLGMLAVAGEWLGVVVTLAALALTAALLRGLSGEAWSLSQPAPDAVGAS